MTRVVLATTNANKAAEIRSILSQVAFVERPADVPEVIEDGETLEDNARLKAVALCEATGMPAIADDTGLFIDALDGAPGVRSGRYAGESATYFDNVQKMLHELEDVPAEHRGGYFETVALLRFPDGRELVASGRVDGKIATSVTTDQGWGYDPIFIPEEGDGRTFGEMTSEEKHALSHRGRAFRALGELL